MFNGLVKLGVAAGAVYAAMKVADKYKENNPDGVESTTDKINAIKEAAEQVFGKAAGTVRGAAPDVANNVNDFVQKASDFAAEKMPGVIEKVQDAVDKVAEKAPGVAEKVQDAVEKVAEKVSDFAAAAAEKTASDDDFEAVVDAEFEPVEEEKTEE